MFSIDKKVFQTYPDLLAGILVMRNVQNPSTHEKLEERKRSIETELREQYKGVTPQDLEATPPLPAYAAYYRRFDKTYHVEGQLKSIVYKDKPIPSVATLVEAMFMAELKNGLLTAGHDLNKVIQPIILNISEGSESYLLMRGAEQVLKAWDLYIKDKAGILSSILYGPDQRTCITDATRNVIFTIYAPKGMAAAAVEAHLNDICSYVKLVSPSASVEEIKVYSKLHE